MVCEETLKIKHLPKELSDSEKEEFMRHFGATKVKIITSKAKQKSIVYAKFESKEIAREVLFRLHQTFVLKNRLCVEYADYELGLPKIKKLEDTIDNSTNQHFKSFINKLNSFNHSVDFQQPPPPHLKYVYPKANRLTINNIGHALATVPKFYTQVLHLMNRMNLPPPFAVPEPPRKPLLLPPVQIQQKPPEPVTLPVPQLKNSSSSESELESDEELKVNREIPFKRTLPQKKTIKRPKFIKPMAGTSSSKGENIEEVFDKTDVQTQRKIELRVPSTALTQKLTGEPLKIGVIKSQPDVQDEEAEKRTVISDEELSTNQIPAKDLDVLPVFKNYHPGVPTARLYIKNIAKTVEVKDLEYIFNRYKTEEDSSLDIRLMQEGRMKGQAFVTLSSVELAQKALKETNAFILKDKPLVVVFAKSAPAKK